MVVTRLQQLLQPCCLHVLQAPYMQHTVKFNYNITTYTRLLVGCNKVVTTLSVHVVMTTLLMLISELDHTSIALITNSVNKAPVRSRILRHQS